MTEKSHTISVTKAGITHESALMKSDEEKMMKTAPTRQRKASITDVAQQAHVSIATVSRTFSHPDHVSAATRNKVIDAAKKLNFSISRSAGILKSGRSFRIALLMGGSELEWFPAKVTEGLLSVLTPAGYDVHPIVITSPEERKDFFAQLPVRNNVDAVIVSSFQINPREVAQLKTMNVPIIGINVSSQSGFTATSSIDDDKGMRLIIRHLTLLDHTNLLYVYQDFTTKLSYSSRRRIDAFTQLCSSSPHIHGKLLYVSKQEDCSTAVLSSLLDSDNPPTAVCFHQDSLAIPFLYRALKQGIRIPEDLSVTGFDDSTFAAEMGLTTIHQNPKAQAIHAAHTALDLIAGKTLDQHQRLIESPIMLLPRSTTARPRKTTL